MVIFCFINLIKQYDHVFGIHTTCAALLADTSADIDAQWHKAYALF